MGDFDYPPDNAETSLFIDTGKSSNNTAGYRFLCGAIF